MKLHIILKKNKAEFFCALSLSILPIIFFWGNGVGNTLVIIIDFLFLYILIKNKNLHFLNNHNFYILLFFWFILLANLIFSINLENSLDRSLGFVRYIFLIFAIQYFMRSENKNLKYFILKSWLFFMFIISFDLIFEIIYGSNTLGFYNLMPGRLSGFFDQELKIGNLYSSFYLIVLSFILSFKLTNLRLKKKRLKKLNYKSLYFLIIFFIIISFFIGERSNFIKVIIISTLFIFFVSDKWIKSAKIISIAILISIAVISSSKNLHWRYWDAFLRPIIHSPVQFIEKSYYIIHYKSALQVFKNHKLFGVGLKNYRKEVVKEEYPDLASIHPHQVHFEILAELGIIGYLFFIAFFLITIFKSIKSYLETKDIFILSGLLYVTVSLIPILPSGSFFTSFGATMFWMNYAFMTMGLKELIKINK
tara:strand:- start:2243 stop:3505 length:1263 start_codon:yes stop_codon:yes gene_type:complete